MKNISLILAVIILFSSCRKFDQDEPDLEIWQTLSAEEIAPGATIQEIVEVRNIGNAATVGPIVITVTNYPVNSGITITSNTSTDVMIGADNYVLSNVDFWDVTTTPSAITFTSKTGTVIGPSFSLNLGLTIRRAAAPNQGPDDSLTHVAEIQSGAGGESNQTNNTSSRTIIKTKVPDLSASQFFSSLQISPGGTIDEVIRIRNQGSGVTTGPISFTVTNYAATVGLTSAPNNNPTVTIGIDTYTLTNADWNITSSETALTFTSKTGVTIPAGGSKLVGVRITRAASPGQGTNGPITHSVNIVPGTGGGETPSTNNNVIATITKI